MASITAHFPAVAQGLYSGLMRSNYFYSFFDTPPDSLCSERAGTQAIKYLEHVAVTLAIQKGCLDVTFTPNQNLQKWAGRILLVAGLLIATSKSIEYFATKRNPENAQKFNTINRCIHYLNRGMGCAYLVNTVFLIYSAIKIRQTPEITAAAIGSFFLVSNLQTNRKPRFPLIDKAMVGVGCLTTISRIYFAPKQQEKLFLGAWFLYDLYKAYRMMNQQQLPRKLIE